MKTPSRRLIGVWMIQHRAVTVMVRTMACCVVALPSVLVQLLVPA